MKGFLPNKVKIRPVFVFIGVTVLLVVSFDHALPDTVDTLNLQLQWAYPIKVADMKLVDFNHDGINEILVGFQSDSAHVGILDAVSQSWVWQSSGLMGSVYTVAAGDRNNNGSLDIACGGQRSDSSIGYLQVFDGPTFDSIHSASGFDQIVLSSAISTRDQDSLPQIFLGTEYSYQSCYSEYPHTCTAYGNGHLYILDAQDLSVESVTFSDAVRRILVMDINGDAYKELFLGMDYYFAYWSDWPSDFSHLISRIVISSYDSSHSLYLYNIIPQGIGFGISFDAIEVGSFNEGVSTSIIGGGWLGRPPGAISYLAKLACWNAYTYELEWSTEWHFGPGIYTYLKDLAICNFNSEQTYAICVAYRSGLIEFRNGSDGCLLAVSPRQHSIYHMKLGNVDQDSLVEMCTASRDSLFIYDTELLQPKYRPMVSDIPNQTITEGENFTSIKLDDYVDDLDDPDSILVWSHCGESGLLVSITNRVATVTPPNPDWNGAETIWFKACDPGGLCDSGQVIFTVVAVNDTPVVWDIPDQAIAEDENFTSISLDEYVADPDDPDWLMVWSHRGEAALLVDITDRVATVTPPNPEWNGAETIWFKACDPGGLCDSDQAIMTVIPEDDRPVISGISNQTIVEGESFASIRLDDYVTDPDDPDSVMVWSHRGEAGLLVDVTDRVATVTPPNLEWNGTEAIWFKACDPGGLCDSSKTTFAVHPKRFCLLQNYPNPFNPQTNIRFDVPSASNVTLTIYSILGEKVREFEKHYEAGTHTLMWDGKNSSGRDVTSGVYLYKLSAGDFQNTKKMVLIK